MKGFTKGKGKGKKFIPTSRKKSALTKNDCVSRKIPKLRHEGKPQDQSIAIAESMCRKKSKLDERQRISEKHGGVMPKLTFDEMTDFVTDRGEKSFVFSVDGELWFIVKQFRFNDRPSLQNGLWLIMDFQDKDGDIIGGMPIRDDKQWSEYVEHGQLQGFDADGKVMDMRLKDTESLDDNVREKHSFFDSNGSEVDETIQHVLDHDYEIEGNEVAGENINRLSIQEVVLNRILEGVDTVGLNGLDIKGKRDFDNIWGFSFSLLRDLEQDEKIKITKIGNSPFAINISRGNVELKKKYTMDDVLE